MIVVFLWCRQAPRPGVGVLKSSSEGERAREPLPVRPSPEGFRVAPAGQATRLAGASGLKMGDGKRPFRAKGGGTRVPPCPEDPVPSMLWEGGFASQPKCKVREKIPKWQEKGRIFFRGRWPLRSQGPLRLADKGRPLSQLFPWLLAHFFVKFLQGHHCHFWEGGQLGCVEMVVIGHDATGSCGYSAVYELVVVGVCRDQAEMVERCHKFYEGTIDDGLDNIRCQARFLPSAQLVQVHLVDFVKALLAQLAAVPQFVKGGLHLL